MGPSPETWDLGFNCCQLSCGAWEDHENGEPPLPVQTCEQHMSLLQNPTQDYHPYRPLMAPGAVEPWLGLWCVWPQGSLKCIPLSLFSPSSKGLVKVSACTTDPSSITQPAWVQSLAPIRDSSLSAELGVTPEHYWIWPQTKAPQVSESQQYTVERHLKQCFGAPRPLKQEFVFLSLWSHHRCQNSPLWQADRARRGSVPPPRSVDPVTLLCLSWPGSLCSPQYLGQVGTPLPSG